MMRQEAASGQPFQPATPAGAKMQSWTQEHSPKAQLQEYGSNGLDR